MTLFHGVHPKKITVPALVLTLLFSALAGSLLISLAAANPGMPAIVTRPPSPIVEVMGINTDSRTLTFTVQKAGPYLNGYGGEWAYSIISVEVFVDGKLWSRLGWSAGPVSVSLAGLSGGWHSLEVVATAEGGGVNGFIVGSGLRYMSEGSSGVMEFLVDSSAPSVSILSLADAAAGGGDFQLAFRVVGKSLSWVGYSLDGMENVTVSPDVLVESSLASQYEVWKGNVTLVGLSGGSHSVVVYAEEVTGSVGASSPVTFTVETQATGQPRESQQTTFPTTLVISAIVVAAVVSFGLMAYFIRRKRRSIAT
jgi:hypothetical protein